MEWAAVAVNRMREFGAELRRLAARAKSAAIGDQFMAAVKEFDRRLRIYPQFGQLLRDLKLEPSQFWIGVVPPLVVRYLDSDTFHSG